MDPLTLIGGGIAGLGNVIGGFLQADAQKKAAAQYNAAAQRQLEAYKQAYDQAFGAGSYNDKTQRMGLDAAQQYAAMLNNPELWNEWITGQHAYQAPEAFSFTAEDLYSDPSYQFRLKQGQDALSQNQVAGGLNLSGAAAKQMNDYTQNVASTEFQNAYKRANDQYNTDRSFDYNAWLNNAKQYYSNLLSQLNGQNTLSNNGINANNAQATALQGMAGVSGNTAAQQAAANASATNANANAWGNVANVVGNLVGTGVANMNMGGEPANPISTQSVSVSPTQFDFSTYASGSPNQNDVVNLMNGFNPYLANQYPTNLI